MKRNTLLLTLGLLISFNSFSQNTYNSIFFTDNGEKFWVIVNGVRQNETAETNVKVVGLNASGYRYKIVFQDATISDIDRNVPMPENSAEVTFRIKQNKKGEYKLRYFGEVPLPAKPVQAPAQQMVSYSTTEVYAADPREETTTTTTTTTTTSGTAPTGGSSENVSINMNIGGLSMGVNVNVDENHGNTGTTTTSSSTTTTTTTSSSSYSSTPVAASTTTHDHYVMKGYSGPRGCPWPMEDGDYAAAKSTIASNSFDDTKLTVAKQIVGSNCLFADQVLEITKMMSFEDSKLDFAKFAYTRTYDQGNYFKVNNAFDFESTIEELNEYINVQR
ncbi:MAG: DUF4476 domain-containing protein [Flavobacteriales bacterium]|nr:DUF4476 domain-containing protein [Flavobacteriales bacterium]